MAKDYAANELFAEGVGNGSGLRAFPSSTQPKTFAAGSGTLAKLTPVAYNTATDRWVVWGGNSAASEAYTISFSAAVTAGKYNITINGEKTADIAFDATNATVKAAIIALGNVDDKDVTLSGGPLDSTHPLVITFGGQYAGKAMTVAVASAADADVLVGGEISVAKTTAIITNGTDKIKGFVWPDEIVLDAAKDVLGVVMMSGLIHASDIVIPTGQSAATLKIALCNGVRELGFNIQGLEDWR